MRLARRISVHAATAFVAAAAFVAGGVVPATQAVEIRSRLIVHTHGAVPTASRLAAAAPEARVRAVRRLAADLAVVTVAADARSAAAALGAVRQVASVSADRRVVLAGTAPPVSAGSAWFRRQWDLWDRTSTKRAGGYGIDAARAWTVTKGDPSVVVAVLDTGITPHPDFDGARILPGYDFVSGDDGVGAGDGDGWDADPSDEGDACAAPASDSSWHGTFVSGEIVAQHDGGGVAGAAPGVSLLPVRVLGACGGTTADTVAAIEWASGGQVPGVPVNPTPAKVLSMSIATQSGSCDAALQSAIDDATGRGSVVIAAAGNESHGVSIDSPANCRGVVSVASTGRSGALASYSNRGNSALSPTIAAPGGTERDPVWGDSWTSRTAFGSAANRPAVVAEIGTSMAAPRVAAAAALLLSVSPGLAPAEVTRRLTATATRFPSSSSCTPVRCGAGVVNAGNLVGAKKRFVRVTSARVAGTAAPGRLLRAEAALWRPTPTALRYRWFRDGTPVAGATGRTFRVRPTDLGHRISVRVTAVRSGTASASDRSASVRVRG